MKLQDINGIVEDSFHTGPSRGILQISDITIYYNHKQPIHIVEVAVV
uniref:Uncharacterized protein n=1 Tax=Meloidogyne enterolobii TaxID=390850 RepID=A0A6V7WTY4_MELEN|nr:unnamed protein product [Meloidogyne enterolobii]